MTRPTNPNRRSRNVDENLNKSDLSTRNNKPTSTSKNKTAPPTLRNIAENNEKTIYPSIQLEDHKNKKSINNTDEDSSSLVESSSQSEEDVIDRFKKFSSEPTLSSRQTSAKEKNNDKASEVRSIPFFEHMPEDVIRKILFEQFIDLNDIPATAKNLMHFASISKFNREFVRQLLTEEGMHEVSFEITKSVIPNLLATLANDKKAQFSDADIDELVHNWPCLTFDSSLKENTIFTNRGLEALKKIVCHPDLKEIRIINNLPEKNYKVNENFLACNNNGLELIYSLLSRKSANPLKVDFIFKNWIPLEKSKFQLKDKSLDLIKKIQKRASQCNSVIFGEIDLSRNIHISLNLLGYLDEENNNRKYQSNFVKMMSNIAVTRSAHKISLVDLYLAGNEVAMIIDEIKACDKPTLENLDMSGNDHDSNSMKSLCSLLESNNTCLKTLKLNDADIFEDELTIFYEALKNNHSLELVELKNTFFMPANHPIKSDKRVKIN